VRELCSAAETTAKDRATIVRQVYICLWVLFVLARDADNVEGPYRASEFAILHAWKLICDDVNKRSRITEEISATFSELVTLHFLIWDELLDKKILPVAGIRHAVSTAVHGAAVDVNIKLFEVLGRVALRGLWLLWSKSGDDLLPRVRADWDEPKASGLAQKVVDLIRNNPVLLAPVADAQSIDVGLALMFLTMTEGWQLAARSLVDQMINRVSFAYLTDLRQWLLLSN
jgi:hypothetical protein